MDIRIEKADSEDWPCAIAVGFQVTPLEEFADSFESPDLAPLALLTPDQTSPAIQADSNAALHAGNKLASAGRGGRTVESGGVGRHLRLSAQPRSTQRRLVGQRCTSPNSITCVTVCVRKRVHVDVLSHA